MNNEQLYNDLEEAGRLLHNVRHNLLYRAESMRDYIKTDIAFVKALVDKLDLLYNPKPNIEPQPQLQQTHVSGGASPEPFCTCSKGKGLDTDDDGLLYCVDCGLQVQNGR